MRLEPLHQGPDAEECGDARDDPGQDEQKGGLLYARYGKGAYVYVAGRAPNVPEAIEAIDAQARLRDLEPVAIDWLKPFGPSPNPGVRFVAPVPPAYVVRPGSWACPSFRTPSSWMA